jgi:hypothetical protein
MGGQTVITAVGNQFAYELLDANTIGVKDGVIITTEGRRIQLDANAIDSFDIPTGAQGTTNYYIIGYHLVTGDLSEQTCETFVQLMENGTDTIPEGSFRDGDDEVFISLYRVEQNDLTIGTITALLPQLSGSFQSQITELNNDLAEKADKNNVPDFNTTPIHTMNNVNGAVSYTPTVNCLVVCVLSAVTGLDPNTGQPSQSARKTSEATVKRNNITVAEHSVGETVYAIPYQGSITTSFECKAGDVISLSAMQGPASWVIFYELT